MELRLGTMTELAWGALFGLLFMAMGPIQSIAVFRRVGKEDNNAVVRAPAVRSSALVGTAFVITVLIENALLVSWGVSFPALIGAGGIVLMVLSLQGLIAPAARPASLDPEQTNPTSRAFPSHRRLSSSFLRHVVYGRGNQSTYRCNGALPDCSQLIGYASVKSELARYRSRAATPFRGRMWGTVTRSCTPVYTRRCDNGLRFPNEY